MNIPPSSRPSWVEKVGRKVLDQDYGSAVDPQRDGLVLSTSAGAAIGAAVGTYLGFRAQGLNTVSEGLQTHSIRHPRLLGYSHSAHADYDEVCHTEGSGENERRVCHSELEGWWHRYSPRISETEVGQYQSPVFRNSRSLEPLLGGFLGAVGGGLVGLGLGVGINALRRALNEGEAPTAKPLAPEEQKELSLQAGALTLGGGALGLVSGALIGHAAGKLEQVQKEVHTRSWMAPVTQRVNLGSIPRDYYQRNWFLPFPNSAENYQNGTEPVHRDVPVYGPDGRVQMQRVQHTFDTARYGPVSGALMGGLIGTGVGLASGVAASTLLKIVRQQDN